LIYVNIVVGACSEGVLHSLLLEKYNVAVRPTKHFNSSLEVTFVLALTQIIDVVRGTLKFALLLSHLYITIRILRLVIHLDELISSMRNVIISSKQTQSNI